MIETVGVQVLVLSYSGVLGAVYRGEVTGEDLDGALFYCGCTREHVGHSIGSFFAPLRAEYESDPEGATAAHKQVAEAIYTAEALGRVTWRDRLEINSWAQLNELLMRNNLPLVDGSQAVEFRCLGLGRIHVTSYSYDAVVEAVRFQCLPYRVITGGVKLY